MTESSSHSQRTFNIDIFIYHRYLPKKAIALLYCNQKQTLEVYDTHLCIFFCLFYPSMMGFFLPPCRRGYTVFMRLLHTQLSPVGIGFPSHPAVVLLRSFLGSKVIIKIEWFWGRSFNGCRSLARDSDC